MDLAIRARGLSRRVGKDFAVRGVDLNVPRGAVYGLLGPNGAGKTTTVRLLLDLLHRDRGEVQLLGRDPHADPSVRAKIGYVPERPGLSGWMRVERAMRHHATFYPHWDAAHAEELRERLRIPSGRRLRQLSKGEAGKLSLLLALAHRPELLILDEPTDGLDPVARRDFMSLLLDYVAESGATVLISSHLVHELERMADWIGVMEGGRLIGEMSMHDFRSSIKQLRVPAGSAPGGMPLELLSRDPRGREELWSVRGWSGESGSVLAQRGVQVLEVIDLPLEDCYVELLRSREEVNGAR